MVRYLSLAIPFGVKKLWEEWNIRGAILFSLWLQIVLIFLAPIRKSTRKKFVISLLWFAYLLADIAADFAVGLISKSQCNQSNNSDLKPKEGIDLLAFWAPFLLLHLGGPDTITAFALEDNQLWRRRLLGFGFQATTIVYVFFQSLPNKNLWIPTILIFTAGIIKYVERTRALFLASTDKFRDSMLNSPPNCSTLMKDLVYGNAARRKRRQTYELCEMAIEEGLESVDFAQTSFTPHEKDPLEHLLLVKDAYQYFQIFKGLVVDLNFSFPKSDERLDFFDKTAEDALKLIEIELNFMYESLYTKMEVLSSITGYVFRFTAFGSVLATLGLFCFQVNKDEFHKVDIGITYSLLLGAIALDVIAFFMLIFSDWTFVSIKNPPTHHWSMAAVFNSFLAFKMPWWHPCKCKTKSQEKDVQHHVLVTPLLFRRWSGSIPTHNLIRYCLKSSLTRIHKFPSLWGIMFEKILCLLGINEVTKKVSGYMIMIKRKISQSNTSLAQQGKSFKGNGSLGSSINKVTGFLSCIEENVIQFFRHIFRLITMPIKNIVDEMMYVSLEPFTKELWKFIFEEVKNKSKSADTSETKKGIYSARGDWVLKKTYSLDDNSQLLKYVRDVEYDERILLWHVATDLCYYTDNEKVNGASSNNNAYMGKAPTQRQFSKILSDYMLYLLVFHPTTVSSVLGIEKLRFRDTCAEVEKFLKEQYLLPNQDKEACQRILEYTDAGSVGPEKKESMTVLLEATKLATELKRMENQEGKDKWELLSSVWVELVSYAACTCSGSTHAQQLSKGGELINLVWLLMAHFSLG
ncbi:uncharacterized protein LOC111279332 [Durio zibethinus]|uniref:Uncharacterized protein LOC111279332 n=1 Tax=Durio zibethinus TaxID=66656 RepID=A0A6P5X181_DURZI|nr:uncharacterized protein LOC111279332 [Durio zibethinus]